MISEAEALARVFGPDSRGDRPLDRAKTSKVQFVRSQVQLALDSAEAKGHRLSAAEALRAYGWDILKQLASEDAVTLADSANEPSETLRRRREALNLKVTDVARRAQVSEEAVVNAETPGAKSSIHVLERLAETLGLNEYLISFKKGAGGDARLGVRLREYAGDDRHRFSIGEVFGLAEAAWVIARQTELEQQCGTLRHLRELGFEASRDYSFPTFEVGKRLAKRARNLLGFYDDEPIASLRALAEDRLGIPLLQARLDPRFGGATVANGAARGIVINESGKNENVFVRRFTMAHELGHLLWDPDDRLDSLMVDEYSALENFAGSNLDEVEIRANSFAVNFLAPPEGVKKIVEEEKQPARAVLAVIHHYGIGLQAAKYHIKNTAGLNCGSVRIPDMEAEIAEWLPAENLSVDFYPLEETPITRRGRFSGLVAKAVDSGLISSESAAKHLHASPNDAKPSIPKLRQLIPV